MIPRILGPIGTKPVPSSYTYKYTPIDDKSGTLTLSLTLDESVSREQFRTLVLVDDSKGKIEPSSIEKGKENTIICNFDSQLTGTSPRYELSYLNPCTSQLISLKGLDIYLFGIKTQKKYIFVDSPLEVSIDIFGKDAKTVSFKYKKENDQEYQNLLINDNGHASFNRDNDWTGDIVFGYSVGDEQTVIALPDWTIKVIKPFKDLVTIQGLDDCRYVDLGIIPIDSYQVTISAKNGDGESISNYLDLETLYVSLSDGSDSFPFSFKDGAYKGPTQELLYEPNKSYTITIGETETSII